METEQGSNEQTDMHPFDHDYEPVLHQFGLSSMSTMLSYYDYIFAYNIVNNHTDCPGVSFSFQERHIRYSLRLLAQYSNKFTNQLLSNSKAR